MDYASDLEFVSPLVVSIVAVWLGYRYQRVVFDREKRREAYLEGYSTLSRMSAVIEYQEQLEFLSSTSARTLIEDPRHGVELIDSINQYFARLATMASMLGLAVDYESLALSSTQADRAALAKLPGQIMARLLAEEVQLRERMDRAVLLAQAGTRLGIVHRSRRAVGVMRMELVLWKHLEAVFFAIADPATPRKVDWQTIDRMLSDFHTAALEELGITDHMVISRFQGREPPPWPEGTPLAVALVGRVPTTQP